MDEGLAGVGLRLREAREAKGYSRAVLARKTGVGERTITKAEGRASAPDADTLLLLARELNQDPWFLVFGEAATPPRSADAGDDLAGTVSHWEQRLERLIGENRQALAGFSERQQCFSEALAAVELRLQALEKPAKSERPRRRKIG